MLELSRTVRFCLNPGPADDTAPRDNTFSSWPPMRGLGRYYELTIHCRGQAHPRTGYFINIKHIDTAVRDHALPVLRRAVADEQTCATPPMGTLLSNLLAALQPALDHSVTQLQFQLTPMLSLSLRTSDMDSVLIKQQYEFSAAHRLHVPEYDDQENRAIFGKCNNPAGHGHNYRLEVAVCCPIDAQGRSLDAASLDAVVNAHVIEALDHKHLNDDVPAFKDLNPSVEHIVKVIWSMLENRLPGASVLEALTVWETGKTACTYRGPAV